LARRGVFHYPIYAALKFSLQNINGSFSLSPIAAIPSQPGLAAAFFLSMRLAFVTLAIVLFLMVPTMIYVHMKMPRFRRFMEVVTILPIVIPPIVLILGVWRRTLWLKASPYLLALVYVVLAMPFVYRSLDSGLGALDVKTLVEAARSLGAGWISTIWRVLVPNLRSALLSATVLTLALVLGEFHDGQSRPVGDVAGVDRRLRSDERSHLNRGGDVVVAGHVGAAHLDCFD